MSNNIVLKKGLDIPIAGAAETRVSKSIAPERAAIVPSDYKGLMPRLLVKEGDTVKAGSPVFADKSNPDILVTSPVSGTVAEVVRGEKRKLLAVLVNADEEQKYAEFDVKGHENFDADKIRQILLASGLWAGLIQRPYGVVAHPAKQPKGIFISGFNTAPLAPCAQFAHEGDFAAIQTAVALLGRFAPVHVGVDSEDSFLCKLKGVQIHVFKGQHPAGNVGVQIANISPIKKDETVWTLNLVIASAIGRLFLKGRVDLRRKVAVTGPACLNPSYVETISGMPVACLKSYYGNTDNIRCISGDVLSGAKVGENGYLRLQDEQVTFIIEGNEKELFGWARPFRFNQFSSDHSYFHWLFKPFIGKKKYELDTNLHGGPRAFVMSDGYYSKVLPMDIYPVFLVKACIAQDIEKMEKYGIYEVLPEDLALCEYIDPSKNYIQDIIAKGIDLMIKEMA